MELIDELQVHYEGFAKRMKGRIYYDDQETKSLLEGYAEELASFIFKELEKAKEEGRREVLSKIKEIFETNIPRGLYPPSETSYLYERFGSAIQQYYTHELSKLN